MERTFSLTAKAFSAVHEAGGREGASELRDTALHCLHSAHSALKLSTIVFKSVGLYKVHASLCRSQDLCNPAEVRECRLFIGIICATS